MEESNINNQNKITINSNNHGKITKIILWIVFTIIVLGLIIYLGFNYLNNKTNNTSDNNQVEENNQNVITVEEQNNNEENSETEDNNDVETTSNNYLTIYKNAEYGYLCLDGNNCSIDTNNVEAFKVPVSTEKAKLVAIDNDNTFILYTDNGVKIYDVQNKKSYETDLQDVYKDYMIFKSDDKKQVIGIGYKDKDDYIGYYNVLLKKKLYDKKYKIDRYPFMSQVNDNYLSVSYENKVYLLSSKTEKIELQKEVETSEADFYGYASYGENGKYFYTLEICTSDCVINKVYNSDLKEFYSGEIYDGDYTFNSNNMYINDKNYIKTYNNEGELISTSKKYNDIKLISGDYVVYVADNKLYLEKISDESESKALISWKEEWFLDIYSSGYYTRGALDSLGEKNKSEGFYVVIEYDNKDTNGNYGMEYCYTSSKDIIEYPIKEEIGGRAKPVLYLYPEKAMHVKVSFAHPEYLTTTYPKYHDSWNVYAKSNGDLYDSDGKYYYALYWDEKRYHEVDFSEGFYVSKDNAINFLEEKLSIIGLNNRERNEFIMYWLPILEKNENSLVYFELTKEREQSNKIIITPKPDSLLRVNIHIKKVNQKVKIKEEKLESFQRKGFVAVEWGGMNY